MKLNYNLGVAKEIVSNKITSEYINESKIVNSKKLINKLVETIKSSPILIKEYSVYYNIENKHIDNDIIATKFIDNNIARFSKYTVEEINEAHKNLYTVIDESDINHIDENKLKLYNSINTLIIESVNEDSDVNKMHSAYENVLTFIKENVQVVDEDLSIDINENVDIDMLLSVASKKFKEKYSTLNESDIKLVNTLVYGSTDEKKDLFENLKSSNIEILKSIKSNDVEDKINEAIDKLSKMVYNEDNLILKIEELKNLQDNLR